MQAGIFMANNTQSDSEWSRLPEINKNLLSINSNPTAALRLPPTVALFMKAFYGLLNWFYFHSYCHLLVSDFLKASACHESCGIPITHCASKWRDEYSGTDHSCCFCPIRLFPGDGRPPLRCPGFISISILKSSTCCHCSHARHSMDIQWNVLLLTKTKTLAVLSLFFRPTQLFCAIFQHTEKKP